MKQGLIFFILALVVIAGCGKQVSKDTPTVPSVPRHAIINGPLVPAGDVTDQFSITPDSSKVVYIADEDMDCKQELYVSNIDGSNKIKLSQPLLNPALPCNPTNPSDDKVIRFKISPDSQKVAYVARVNGLTDLYTVNLDGTQRYMANPGVTDGNHKVSTYFFWLNSSNRLVYTSDEFNAANDFGLYESNFDGSAFQLLNANATVEEFYLSNNGAKIVYRRGTIVNPELRSVSVDGTGDVLLNVPFDLVANPSSSVNSAIISPNSTKVAYFSNQVDSTKFELYLVNIDGSGARTKMSGTLVTGGNVINASFTPDSSKIVYLADQDVNEDLELYMNTITNAGAIKVSGAHVAGSDVSRYQVQDTRVIFMGDMIVDGITDLFVADYVGAITKINSTLGAGERVVDFIAENSRVAYMMDKGDSGKFSVYSNSLIGVNEIKLSQNLTGGPAVYDVSQATVAPRQMVLVNGRVIFRNGVSSATYQGYGVSIMGGAIETLTDTSQNGSVILSDSGLGSIIVPSLDGKYAVYRMSINGSKNLLSSRID